MQNWPESFLHRMKQELGDEFHAFVNSLNTPAPVSIRVNPFKKNYTVDSLEKVPWSVQGYYLNERPAFIFDPAFHAGMYYVQEASSMFLEAVYTQVFSNSAPAFVLDACAAPGGKSSHLLSLIPAESLLISNEVIPKRNAILRQNLVKWGVDNVIVTQNETKDFSQLDNFFDLVVVDAPCSGEGLFRRDPSAAEEWSEAAVMNCALRQKNILEHIIPSLKPGGVLIYSTCTFESVEDEDQIRMLIDSGEMELIEMNFSFNEVVKTEYGFRFYPHRVKGEGFFISALRKMGDEMSTRKFNKKNSLKNVSGSVAGYIEHPEKYLCSIADDRVYLIPSSFAQVFMLLSEKFFLRQAGIFAGNMKGKDFVPSHDLSLSIHLKKEERLYNLEADQALLFMKGEPVKLEGAQKGWQLAAYKDCPLGWVKVLDGRVNNYLPKEWRIQKDLPIDSR